jgi:DNA repair protein RecO (recombination protein O)
MSRTYKATGINLKSMPMGESDRLLTILTREFGLVRAMAMGSRKHNSRMGGRSGLFVVNELMLAKGRSLDKVTQAETVESYPGLGQDLKKLTASQYLAEVCLCQALSDQPQEELFCILNEHLKRLERSPGSEVLYHLIHALYQLLILSGIAPQVHLCCVTRQALSPDFANPDWRVGFSIPAGGTVTLAALEHLVAEQPPMRSYPGADRLRLENASAQSQRPIKRSDRAKRPAQTAFNFTLSAPELAVLQQLPQPELPALESVLPPDFAGHPTPLWLAIERVLRQYAQYHFDRQIRSAALIDACFLPTVIPPNP